MNEHASFVEILGEPEPLLVYEGHFTKLMKELHLSTPYYTRIRRALMLMKCIRQLKRGGGTAESQWVLMRPPTLELYTEADITFLTPVQYASDQRTNDLIKRIDELEREFAAMKELVKGHFE